MIILTGNSLGERQKNLNERVMKADNDFDKYKTETEDNDVDKIFMIDLAARDKSIDFILEILKSGDIVHITRALNKSTWIGDDEFANTVSVDNLHVNVIPLMSIKMKKKLLNMLAIVMKNEERSIAFYEYCMKEKLFKIAMKFLYRTPETFKQNIILQKSKAYNFLLSNKEEAMANFIGSSFILAQTILDIIKNDWIRGVVLDLLHHMYSISSEQYLDMLEKYKIIDSRCRESNRIGRRLSKDIIQKHKDRVLKNPQLYVSFLNKNMIAKNSTIDDVKIYAVALFPDETSTFWNINYYVKYKFILDIIPINEKFAFIKKIFNEKYPNEKFEMSKLFYDRDFHNIMTTTEKEDWALRHVASGEEILGNGNDYIWYKFVCFDKAFEEIKKYILISPDSEKRFEVINVLIDSVKTQNELETLLNYYYNRHINEQRHHKVRFIDTLIEKHKVFIFNDKCWEALEKIFYSLDVFNISNYNRGEWNFRAIALVYYIIHGKPVPEVLNEFVHKDIIKDYEIRNISRKLELDKSEMVFQYVHKLYVTAVEALACKELNEEVKTSIDRYIQCYLNLLQCYSKTKKDISDIIFKFIKLNWNKFKYHNLLADNVDFSQKTIMRYVKKDASLVIDNFSLIKHYIQKRLGQTNWMVRKLKIYFQHDIAQKYLQLLTDCLSDDNVHYRMAQVSVYGIFKLADEPFKVEFLSKYVPTNPKIDHAKISRNLLQIQQAICAYACISRPPLPLSCVLQYITGDYVHSCLPMFHSYLMNLPMRACISFVEAIIDKPLSIQKHGLRLAFQCFSSENLKKLISDIWKRTKNVSMRKILYKSLFDKVLKESGQTQLELFEVLNTFTLKIHQDDDDDLFILMSNSKLPSHLRGQHLISAWNTVKNLPERSVNFKRMTNVIKSIENDLNLVPEDELIIIMDEHISKMLDEKQILNTDNNSKKGMGELLKAKWELVLKYLANVYTERQLQNNLKVVKHIVKMCIEMWNEVPEEKYVMREFCRSFFVNLQTKSYNHYEVESYPYMKTIYAAILKDLQESVPEHDIFTLTLQLRLSDISRDVIIAGKSELSKNPDKDELAVAIRISINRFAEALVILFGEYINNGKYFASFHTKMDNYITNELTIVNRSLDVYFKLKLNVDDLCVLTCVGLLKFETLDVFLLILRLLPINYTGIYYTDYEKTVNTVKCFKNTEVQYYMFEKFVNNDLVFRKQMLNC